MTIEFRCPQCHRRLAVPDNAAGKQAKCPQCGTVTAIPAAGAPATAAPSATPATGQIFCIKCGQPNAENSFRCSACGTPLHETGPQYMSSDDGTIGGLIPFRNAQALWAYYLGIFSLIPCAGIPLGIAALVLGIRGLGYANDHPEAKGKVHAWIGIVLGGGCALVYVLGVVLFVIGMIASQHR
jgi:phage FluMu protein Com